MNDNRRDFLKKISLAGAAAITLPGILPAMAGDRPLDSPVSKTFLFQGDSITDGGRSNNMDWNHLFGQDYAYLIASRLNYEYPDRDYKFFNRGISGNTVNNLAERWQQDALDIKPDLLSILVGINDVFAVVVKGEKITADDFGHTYDALLAKTISALPGVELVICEPFILPVGMVKKNLTNWTTEVQKRQPIVKAIAVKYNAVYVPLQAAFDKATLKAPAEHWIWDGVHPMPAGHELIAREWLKTVNKRYKIL
ncbi:GDSL-type esterase/lipase family protein [Mucilaginibacter sp.]|uniref:GDSL-type esterase/lipase family protein n=1 Tax=Mucilaginibacter sp. TaxID=1882438 RepID=UPI003D0D6A04